MLFRAVIIMAILCFFHHSAYAAPILLGDYSWGTPKERMQSLPDTHRGEDEFENDLIRYNEVFCGITWTSQYQFNQTTNSLRSITLMTPYSREKYNTLKKSLEENGFEVLGFVVDEKVFDLFQLIKANGIAAFQRRFKETLREKTPHRVSSVWFDTRNVSNDQKKMVNSMGEFLRIVPSDIRRIELTQLGDETTSGPKVLLLSVSLPVLDTMPQHSPATSESSQPLPK